MSWAYQSCYDLWALFNAITFILWFVVNLYCHSVVTWEDVPVDELSFFTKQLLINSGWTYSTIDTSTNAVPQIKLQMSLFFRVDPTYDFPTPGSSTSHDSGLWVPSIHMHWTDHLQEQSRWCTAILCSNWRQLYPLQIHKLSQRFVPKSWKEGFFCGRQ